MITIGDRIKDCYLGGEGTIENLGNKGVIEAIGIDWVIVRDKERDEPIFCNKSPREFEEWHKEHIEEN